MATPDHHRKQPCVSSSEQSKEDRVSVGKRRKRERKRGKRRKSASRTIVTFCHFRIHQLGRPMLGFSDDEGTERGLSHTALIQLSNNLSDLLSLRRNTRKKGKGEEGEGEKKESLFL